MRAVEAMAQPMAQITIEKPAEGDIPAIIGMVSAEPNRTRTTRASVTQPWLFRKAVRRDGSQSRLAKVGRLALWL